MSIVEVVRKSVTTVEVAHPGVQGPPGSGGGGGSGTVTSVSVATANGVSGSVATATTTPAITLSLGNITPTSVAASGTVTGSNLSGTNTGDETGARIATLLHASSAKTTLVDADEVNGTDSAGSFGLIRTTWANVRAYLLSYFAPKGAVTTSGLTMSAACLLGRNTASTGAIEEITLGTNLSFSGTTLNATGGTGDFKSDGSVAMTGSIALTAISTPATPASGIAKFYAEPTAGSKTRIMAKFASGAVTCVGVDGGVSLNNLFLGDGAGAGLTSGSDNTGVGFNALTSVTTAQRNTAVGVFTLVNNISGNYNTAVGWWSLKSNTGTQNNALGAQALQSNSTGNDNNAVGFAALFLNTTGQFNNAVGSQALFNNSTGSFNSAIGGSALYAAKKGSNNTAQGFSALSDLGSVQTAGAFVVGVSYTIASVGTTNFVAIGAASNTVGVVFVATGIGSGTGTASPNNTSNNTAIGCSTGLGIITGSNNTIIGANVTGLSPSLSNTVIIADGAGNQRIVVNSAGGVSMPGVLALGLYTVATLPSAATSGNGARSHVSDALAPTFGATVAGGGAVSTPVYSDGTNWKVG